MVGTVLISLAPLCTILIFKLKIMQLREKRTKKSKKDKIKERLTPAVLTEIRAKLDRKRQLDKERHERYKKYPDAPRRPYTFGIIQDNRD